MSRRRSLVRLGIWFGLAVSAAAQVPSASRPIIPADYSNEGLARRAAAVRPDVEAVLGHSLGADLRIVAGAPRELERMLVEELGVQQSGIVGGARGEALRADVAAQAQAIGAALLAKVDLREGTILICPENIRSFARMFVNESKAEILGQDLLDVIIAHESTHVFQVRAYDLRKLIAPAPTLDEVACRGAVAEGHADFVARQVAARRGLGGTFALYRRLQGQVPPTVRGVIARQLSQIVASFFEFQYVEGERFVSFLAKELGADAAAARLFADPPRSRRVVAHPEEYLRPTQGRPDLSAVGERLRRLETERGFKARVVGLPSQTMRQILLPLGAAKAQAILDAFIDGKIAIGTTTGSGGSSKTLSAGVMLMESEPAARALVDAELDVSRKKDEQARQNAIGGMEFESADYSEVPWEGGGPASLVIKRVVMSGGLRVRISQLFLVRASTVWEMSAITSARAADEESRPAGDAAAEFGTREYLVALTRDALAEAESAPVAQPVESRPESREAPAIVEVDGTVAYRGGDPAKEFTIRLWDVGPDHRIVTIQGKDGAFDAELAAGRCRFGRVVADGDDHDELIGDQLVVREGKRIEVTLEQPDVITVTVVDKATNAPIPGARLYAELPGSMVGIGPVPEIDRLEPLPPHTGSDGRARILRGAEWREVGTVFAVKDGYAWAHGLAHQTKDVRLELEPGGVLDVHVDGFERAGLASLTLRHVRENVLDELQGAIAYHDEGAPTASRPADLFFRAPGLGGIRSELPDPDAQGNVRVVGLRPGPVCVAVEQGTRAGSTGQLLAARVAIIAAGEARKVELSVPHLPRPVSLRGRIEIPAAWRGTGDWKADLRGDEEATIDVDERIDLTGSERVVEFHFPRLTPGRYVVCLREAGWGAPIEVGERGSFVDLKLPEPWELLLRLETDEGANPPPKVLVGWNPVSTGASDTRPGASRCASVPSFVKRGVKGYTILAPPGRLQVEVSAPGFATVLREFDAVAGKKEEVLIRVPRAGTLAVTLDADEGSRAAALIERYVSETLRLEPESGGAPILRRIAKKEKSFDDLPPGAYKIRIGDGEADDPLRFEPSSEQVLIRAGETTTVRIKVSLASEARPK